MTLNDFTRVTTEWDLLTFLAQEEGFSVWVSGNTLNFQPVPPPTQNPVVITLSGGQDPWVTSNAATVRLRRALTLARDIQVTVQSWSSRTASAFKVTAKATGAKKASASATAGAGQTTTQNYVYTRPNLTHAQAQALANQKLAELSAHERVVTITMAGETSMTPRQGLQIMGTGTNFDLAYYITEINRHIDAEGFGQTVTAKNSSPKDTSVVG
jgi:phage protein D